MPKRIMFVSGSVWEAELLIQSQKPIKHVHWEDQKTFLYCQPQLMDGLQTIFVVTGYDASYAKRALADALAQFPTIDQVIGHGFCVGLVKHCEAGDPVIAQELMLASFPEVLPQPRNAVQSFNPSPLWTKVLALKKTFESEIEKAAVYASSNMEVMDPICGVWYKLLAQKGVPFTFIKGLLDGGNEVGIQYLSLLDVRGQFQSGKVLRKSFTQPFAALDFRHLKKYRATELLEKSHQIIRAFCQDMAAQDEDAFLEVTKPSVKLDMPFS